MQIESNRQREKEIIMQKTAFPDSPKPKSQTTRIKMLK